MILFILSSCMSPRLRAGWLVAHPPSYSTSFPQWRDSPILPQFPQPGCARSHTTMSGLLLARRYTGSCPRLPEDRRDFCRERFCSTEDDLPVSIHKP